MHSVPARCAQAGRMYLSLFSFCTVSASQRPVPGQVFSNRHKTATSDHVLASPESSMIV